jgi:hypothetical protein
MMIARCLVAISRLAANRCAGRAEELERLCEKNLGTTAVWRLADLYERIYKHDSQ